MNENTSNQRLERLNQVRMSQNRYNYQTVPNENETYSYSTFGIRMLIAALLFVGYFFLQKSESNIGFINAEVIQTEVNRYSDVDINLFDFMEDFTYTLNAE